MQIGLQLADIVLVLTQARALLGRLDMHLADLGLQVSDIGGKPAGIDGKGIVAQLKREGFFAFTQKILGGARVFGGIQGTHHVFLGADLLRAQRHRRFQPVFGIPDDAAVYGRRNQKDEEGRGQEAQSEQESVFDHGGAIDSTLILKQDFSPVGPRSQSRSPLAGT
ncbi:hypothetical protein RHECNPAF_3500065 [Rhizobium etli CNPAF512]|nr:hypothetical protein RHECNPAF_3500065 [Rhizobium etli CNPAF512]